MSNNNFNSEKTIEFINSLGSSDLHSFILCLEAYNNLDYNEKSEIEFLGFNQYSGNIYICMQSGIIICFRI
jgi:hypothetical protein